MNSDPKLIFDCSVSRANVYLGGDLNKFIYRYDCNHTLTDETTRSYKIECKPKYSVPMSQIPKRREDATIECVGPKIGLNEYSVIWAVPCNNIQECYDGEDESGCKFPFWTIPSILFGTGIVLGLAFAAYLYKYSRQDWNVIMQDRQWRLATQKSDSKESEKAFKIALLAHGEDIDGIMKFFATEIETHGSEATAICYLKVQMISFFKMRHLTRLSQICQTRNLK